MTRKVAFLGLVLALACGRVVPRTFSIPSDAMAPSVRKGDRIACSREAPEKVERGDVVVFEGAGTPFVPQDAPSTTFVKRVVGLPGEQIAGDERGVVVNGTVLPEPYTPEATLSGDFGPITVGEGEYFLLGDNRDASSDSRFNGAVPHEKLLASCTRIVSPGDREGPIPGT